MQISETETKHMVKLIPYLVTGYARRHGSDYSSCHRRSAGCCHRFATQTKIQCNDSYPSKSEEDEDDYAQFHRHR